MSVVFNERAIVNFNQSITVILLQDNIWPGNTRPLCKIYKGPWARIQLLPIEITTQRTVLPGQMLSCSKITVTDSLKLTIVFVYKELAPIAYLDLQISYKMTH